ncbi:monooxygenase family protein [Streptomyces tritici]|uniref:monooxygenase family protein n=1 Tax=Streptomyces tritici TaxID=2054410 RepID=UPI003AF04435
MARYGFWQFIRFAATPAWRRGGPEGRAERRRVRPGLVMAENSEPVAVFLIGARINRLRKVRHWWPVVAAMPAMLKELTEDPDSGLLGYRLLLGPDFGEVTIVQYWRRTGDIRAFAGDGDRGHRPAEEAFWARYDTSDGAIGIWHEMYSVRPGAYHALYGDMHPSGVGAIKGLRQLEHSGHGHPVPVRD